MFIHGSRGTFYFYNEDVDGFLNGDGKAYLCIWAMETPHVVQSMIQAFVAVDPSAYLAPEIERG